MTTGMLPSTLLEEPVQLLKLLLLKIMAVAKLHTTQDSRTNIAIHNKYCRKVNENSVLYKKKNFLNKIEGQIT